MLTNNSGVCFWIIIHHHLVVFKIGEPPVIIYFSRIFHEINHPASSGYHHFRKPPFIDSKPWKITWRVFRRNRKILRENSAMSGSCSLPSYATSAVLKVYNMYNISYDVYHIYIYDIIYICVSCFNVISYCLINRISYNHHETLVWYDMCKHVSHII